MPIGLVVVWFLAQSHEIQVSKAGDDLNPGTIEAPLRTLEAARDRVRDLVAAGLGETGGVTVRVEAGLYERQATFELAAPDGGGGRGRVVYQAHGRVVLSGGRVIPPGALVPVEGDERAGRLSGTESRQEVRRVDLRALGIDASMPILPRGFSRPIRPAPAELYWNDLPMTLARWPDDGYARTGEVIVRADGAAAASLPDGVAVALRFDAERLARWQTAGDIWLYGYWKHDWADESLHVSGIDLSKGLIDLSENHHYGIEAGKPFFAENLLEELDRPGEYFIDRARGMLYLWPPGPVDRARLEISLFEGPLIDLDGVSGLTLAGFELRACRGVGIRIRGGADLSVECCRLHELGDQAIVVEGGSRHRVVGCDIENTGEGGITMHGGDRATLEAAGHEIVANQIRAFNRRGRTYRPGVGIGGVGIRVLRNWIHDAPHAAILFSGNDHLIAGNDIYDVLRETGDGGAIYTGRDWTARGTVIRDNRFHDIHGLGLWENAVYLDDSTCGVTVADNVFERCHWGLLVGGGRDNVIRGNVFVDCDLALHGDARGLGWAGRMEDTLRERLAAVPYQDPIWRRHYPRLARILEDEPMAPKGNVIRDNVLIRSGRIDADLHPAMRENGLVEGNVADD